LFHGPDITFLWSKTAESQLIKPKGDIWAEFAQLSFLPGGPRYFRDRKQQHTHSGLDFLEFLLSIQPVVFSVNIRKSKQKVNKVENL
jgi:hypothetical protein